MKGELMKKTFVLVILILAVVLGMSGTAWAANFTLNDLITNEYLDASFELKNNEGGTANCEWKAADSLVEDGLYAFQAGYREQWYASTSTMGISVTDASMGGGIVSFDYRIDSLGFGSSVELTTNFNETASTVSLAKTDGTWVTRSITVNPGEITGSATLKYFKKAGNKGDVVAIRNIRFTSGNVKVDVENSNEGSGTISVTANGTPVETSSELKIGTEVTLTAVPASGCRFYGWADQYGNLLGKDPVLTYNVNSDTKITAYMAEDGFMIAQYGGRFFSDLNSAFADAVSDSGNKGYVVLIDDAVMTGNVTVPSGITFLLPYEDGNTKAFELGGSNSDVSSVYAWLNPDKYLNHTLTIPSGSTLTVNGELMVGGVRMCASAGALQGHTSGAYSQIENHGSIMVNGTMEVHGLIQGKGTVTVNTVGKLYEPFTLLDYAGGSNTMVLFDPGKQFPFGQFTCANVQNTLKVLSGGEVWGYAGLYVQSLSTMPMEVPVCIIGKAAEGKGLILLDNGAEFTRVFNKEKNITPAIYTNPDVAVSKSEITLSGGGRIGVMSLDIMDSFSSKGVYLGLPYNFDVNLTNGEYTVTEGVMCRLMPGSEVTIAQGAVLNVDGTLLVYEGLYDTAGRNSNFYPSETLLYNAGLPTSGCLYVDGTLNVNAAGGFAGIAQANRAGGLIQVESGAALSYKDVSYGALAGKTIMNMTATANNLTKHDLTARVRNLNNDGFMLLEAGKSYESMGHDTWELTSYLENRYGDSNDAMVEEAKLNAQNMYGVWDKFKYDVTFYTDETCTTVIETQRIVPGDNAVAPSASAVKKDADGTYHYEFDSWSESLTNVQRDMQVYAVYAAEKHGMKYTDVTAGGHKQTCETCGYTTSETAHSYEGGYSESKHYDACICGSKINEVNHDMVQKYDASGHWNQCSSGCEYKSEVIAHSMEQKTAGGHTWTECTGCRYAEGRLLVRGDVNLDGKVNISDITDLARHLACIRIIDSEECLANAEVTGDDRVTVRDLTQIARYVAGIISTLD